MRRINWPRAQTLYYPLFGGEDLVTPPLSVSPGRARFTTNYECDINGRYRSVEGFERYDGRNAPSSYTDPVQIAAARALIEAVPGSGSVRGVHLYNGTLYAFRDNAGATACVMHKATSGGWSAISLGEKLAFTSGGTVEVLEGQVVIGAISNMQATVERVVVTDGAWGDGDAVGYFIISGRTGALTAETLNVVGGTSNVATIAANATSITLSPGGRFEFVNYNFYATVVTQRMYGCDGINEAFEFDGTVFCPIDSGMAADTPNHIEAHKNQLFLSFEGGIIRHSSVLAPLDFLAVTGANEFGIGEECSGMKSINGGVLAIVGRNKTSLLYGSSVDDWDFKPASVESGAIPWSIQMMNQPWFLDDRGISTLAAVQEYGDFQAGSISKDIDTIVQEKKLSATASVRVKTKNQYRLFFSDNIGIYGTTINDGTVGFTRVNLGVSVACACSGENATGSEAIFIGCSNGYVYQMDSGYSFDGADIVTVLKLHFNHGKSPAIRKKYTRVDLELDAKSETAIYFVPKFSYGKDSISSVEQSFDVVGTGGTWGEAIWQKFVWGGSDVSTATAYLTGSGMNISLFIRTSADDQKPHTLQGAILYFLSKGQV